MANILAKGGREADLVHAVERRNYLCELETTPAFRMSDTYLMTMERKASMVANQNC